LERTARYFDTAFHGTGVQEGATKALGKRRPGALATERSQTKKSGGNEKGKRPEKPRKVATEGGAIEPVMATGSGTETKTKTKRKVTNFSRIGLLTKRIKKKRESHEFFRNPGTRQTNRNRVAATSRP
jgi:hypothetical protein